MGDAARASVGKAKSPSNCVANSEAFHKPLVNGKEREGKTTPQEEVVEQGSLHLIEAFVDVNGEAAMGDLAQALVLCPNASSEPRVLGSEAGRTCEHAIWKPQGNPIAKVM